MLPAAAAGPAPPRAPSIQTTALEASGTSIPERASTTLPATVPPPGGGGGSSARSTVRARVIIAPGSKNHSIGMPAARIASGGGDDERRPGRDLRQGHLTLHDRGP